MDRSWIALLELPCYSRENCHVIEEKIAHMFSNCHAGRKRFAMVQQRKLPRMSRNCHATAEKNAMLRREVATHFLVIAMLRIEVAMLWTSWMQVSFAPGGWMERTFGSFALGGSNKRTARPRGLPRVTTL